jgi:cytochrome b561
MGYDNTAGHWGAVAKSLHWAIALLVFAQVPLGFYAHEQKEALVAAVDFGPARIEDVQALFHLHKSVGIMIGLLVIARLIWRVTHYVPPLSGEMPLALRALAHGTHWALYVLLLTLAASGFFIATASPLGIHFFYLFHIPNLISVGDDTRDVAELVHMIAVWGLIGFTTLHIAAAAFHHFMLKDDTMVKMWPAALGGRGGPMRPSED